MAFEPLVDQVIKELSAWRHSPAGQPFDAPGWWDGMMKQLREIQLQCDVKAIERAFNSFLFLLMEFGPVSPDVVPSIRYLQQAIAGRERPSTSKLE